MFVKRFILSSGSLKDLAQAYGISYPTVRLRLDRLIAKIQVVEDQQVTSPFEKLLRARVRGREDRSRHIQAAIGRSPRRTGEKP